MTARRKRSRLDEASLEKWLFALESISLATSAERTLVVQSVAEQLRVSTLEIESSTNKLLSAVRAYRESQCSSNVFHHGITKLLYELLAENQELIQVIRSKVAHVNSWQTTATRLDGMIQCFPDIFS